MINFRNVIGEANFYFIRHGESTGNLKNIIQGHMDYPLSAKGEEQAQRVANWFIDKEISLIITSPLMRARETAKIIKERAEIENFIEDKNTMELDTGIFSGKTLEELPHIYPQAWERFQQKSWEGVPEAESTKDIYRRAEKHWIKLLSYISPHKKTNIITVSHAGFIQWIIKASFGHREWMPLFPMSNTGISLFSLKNTTKGGINTYLYRWEFINLQV